MAAVGPTSTSVVCPGCKRQVRTQTEGRASTMTHFLAVILCIVGCWPCAVSLYCTDCARDVVHTCPACRTFIGVYQR